MNRKSACRSLNRQMYLWAMSGNEEKADEYYDKLLKLERPWEVSSNRNGMKYSASDLMEIYANRFSDELNEE